jgi:BlaI family transcriptional regulator, penicillinase repressor
MQHGTSQEPNATELEVLKLLWREGKLSAREVHDRLAEVQGWAYSTTRTVLDRMAAKRLLHRRAFHGLNLYEARLSRVRAIASMVRGFAERVAEIPPAAVVPLFAESDTLTREELEELAALLEDDDE